MNGRLAHARHPSPDLEASLQNHASVNDLVSHWARIQPSRTAFSGPGEAIAWRRVSWAELEDESIRIARGLIAAGICPGDHVGILAEGDAYTDCLVAYLGILRAAAVMVPLNPRHVDTELQYAVAHADCAFLIVQTRLLPRISKLENSFPGLRRVFVFSGHPDSGHTSLQALRQDAPPDTTLPTVNRDDLANIIFTSGTTAHPKAVMHTHGRALATGAIFAAALGLDNSDTFHHAIPFFTSSGTQFVLMPQLWVGATLVLEPRFDANTMLERMETEKSTAMIGVPSHYLFLLDELRKQPRALSSMRMFDYGGAAMPGSAAHELARLFPDIEQRQQYGLTETGPSGTILTPEHILQRSDSAGQPMPLCEVKIIDDMGRTLTTGETGEIAVRSPACMLGYYKNDDATGQTLVDGWVHTGDIGHLDEQGFLYFTDRKKDIVNRGGLKLSSVEIEEVLYRHPDVLEAAVVSVPHPKLGEDVLACVVLRPGAKEDAEALKTFCRKHLADYKSPRNLVFLPQFPRNPMGKIQKNLLREMACELPNLQA